MSNRPTPETDAEHAQFAMGGFTLDFCRKLERERDKAREDATNYYAKIGELEHERDEAIADRDILRIDAQREAEHHDRMVGELEKVYKERDEAREELEEEKKFHNRTHSELIQTQCKLMDATQAIIAILEENRHLADGDDCTLAKLKSVVPDWK